MYITKNSGAACFW